MKILLSIILILFTPIFCLAQSDYKTLIENSKVLMESNRYGEAIELLNRLVAANPQSAEGFNLRGICHEKRGNYEQAVYDYRTAIRIAPADKQISENLKRAESDWYRLLYNQIEGYKREIAINPAVSKNYLEIGKCYKNLGEWNEAEIWYDLYLEKEEAPADEILRYTEILAKNNHISKGEPVLKKSVEKYPDDHRLWSRYGYFLFWLGKSRAAENAFNQALNIRPYFKEALDGLDLVRGKKTIYTINDTSSVLGKGKKIKEYLIDNYFLTLRKNPENDKIRFKLIDELIKYKRFEEALQQLEILKPKYSNEQMFQQISSNVENKRNEYLDDQIKELKTLINKNPLDRVSTVRLAELLTYRMQLPEAISLLNGYLKLNDDNEIRFLLAKYYLWDSKLCESKTQLEVLLQKKYSNPEVELMLARIYLWLNSEIQKSEYLFEKYLSLFPENKDAISGLIETKLKLEKYSEAEKILGTHEQLFTSAEVADIKKRIEESNRNKKLSEQYKVLEKAREFSLNKNYKLAIRSYLEYLNFDPENLQAKLELADVYAANSEFDNSNNLYQQILFNNYDYEIAKRWVKNLIWSKDYLKANLELKRLLLKNPYDVETKLMLADCYLFVNDREKARKIYYELLSRAPESYILNQRLVWLGDKIIFQGFDFSLQLIPSVIYFRDNQDFIYSGQSFLLRTALTKNISFGGAIHRGGLSSRSEERTLYLVKGMLNLRITEMMKSEASFGQIFFNSGEKEFFGEFNFSIENTDKFLFKSFFRRTDAALELYSPYLVNKRLYTNSAGLELSFYPGLNFIVSSKYYFVSAENKNFGNQVNFRIGNKIYDKVSLGYELYYYNFKDRSEFYWAPEDFVSHSFWIGWKVLNNSNAYLNLGGKVGIIPENNYFLSEAFSDFNYNFFQNLAFKLYLAGGNTYRKETGGYSSFSFLSSLVFSF